MPSPTSPPRIEVAAGLVFRAGRVLISQRRTGDHLAGLWEFPGGKREPGESYAATLHRELREELGVEIEVIDLLERIDHAYPERLVHLEFFRCRLLKGEPQPLACAQIAWAGPLDLAGYCFPAADQRLLARLSESPGLWRVEDGAERSAPSPG